MCLPVCLSSTSTNHSLMTPAVSSFPDVTRQEQNLRERPIFVLTLHVRKTGKCPRVHCMAGLEFPNVTRQEQNQRGMAFFILTLHVGKTRDVHRGVGIDLFQIVLGLMCPGELSGRGESQNEAKSRRFGMDLPSSAFYEGVNPKTILNNSHEYTKRYHNSASPHRRLSPPVSSAQPSPNHSFRLCHHSLCRLVLSDTS